MDGWKGGQKTAPGTDTYIIHFSTPQSLARHGRKKQFCFLVIFAVPIHM
jgi:hypothetical protein